MTTHVSDAAVFASLLLAGFLGMELVTYLVHRFVMHGALEHLHLSHHRNAAAEFAAKSPEANDVFPLAFSVVVVAAMWAGFNIDGLSWLLPTFVGVTLYAPRGQPRRRPSVAPPRQRGTIRNAVSVAHDEARVTDRCQARRPATRLTNTEMVRRYRSRRS